jgi:hypothetical protein
MHHGYARSVNPPAAGLPGILLGTVVVGGGALAGVFLGRELYHATMCPPGARNAICEGPSAPTTHGLTGMAGSVAINGQDASWNVEPLVGGDSSAPRYAWSVFALPAGTFLTSSEGDFPSVQQALDNLAAHGGSQGWTFGA